MEVLRVQEIMKTHTDHARHDHDPIYEEGCAFMMDEILPCNELKMPLSDGGFRRGGAVYDAVSISRGNFFRLEQHQARLARSCELI